MLNSTIKKFSNTKIYFNHEQYVVLSDQIVYLSIDWLPISQLNGADIELMILVQEQFIRNQYSDCNQRVGAVFCCHLHIYDNKVYTYMTTESSFQTMRTEYSPFYFQYQKQKKMRIQKHIDSLFKNCYKILKT